MESGCIDFLRVRETFGLVHIGFCAYEFSLKVGQAMEVVAFLVGLLQVLVQLKLLIMHS